MARLVGIAEQVGAGDILDHRIDTPEDGHPEGGVPYTGQQYIQPRIRQYIYTHEQEPQIRKHRTGGVIEINGVGQRQQLRDPQRHKQR